ncbi:MAG TPA: hypothetical protein VGI92_13505 [Gemmatimonadales bacterium]|jgi:hypothetical protein
MKAIMIVPFAFALLARPASAQWSRFAHTLNGRSGIRMELASGNREQLDSAHIEDGTLVGRLRGPHERFAVDTADVRRVWRRGSFYKTGIVLGASTGLVLGLAAGAEAGIFLCLADCLDGKSTMPLSAMLAGGAMGALVGGLAGGVIALPLRHWKTVYRANRRYQPRLAFSGRSIGLSIAL